MLAPLTHVSLPYLLLHLLSLSDLFPEQLCARTVALVPTRHAKWSMQSAVKIRSFIANMLFCIIHNLFNYKIFEKWEQKLVAHQKYLSRNLHMILTQSQRALQKGVSKAYDLRKSLYPISNLYRLC